MSKAKVKNNFITNRYFSWKKPMLLKINENRFLVKMPTVKIPMHFL